ncbi:MAG: phage tail protein [Bacteroidota bacterium]
MSAEDRKLPPPGFHFAVKILGGKAKDLSDFDAAFQEVSGISAEMQYDEIKEGGENRFVHRVPSRLSYENLVLKRGLVVWPSAFGTWCKNMLAAKSTTQKQHWVELHDINVSLMGMVNGESKPIRTWTFLNAKPAKWEMSGFNAQESNLVIETITINYQYFRVVR